MKQVMNKFSICIPTHRLDRRLINTLNSLSHLDYPRNLYEICLFVNNVDSTSPGLFKILGTVDKFKIEPAKLGPSISKNEALKLASGKWAILLDSDDFLVPSALNHYNEIIDNNSNLVLGCEWSVLNMMKGGIYHPDNSIDYNFFHDAQMERSIKSGAFGRPIIFNTDHLLPYSNKYSFAEERQLAIDYMVAGYTIDIMGTCTYLYNWNDSGISGGVSLTTLDNDEFKRCVSDIGDNIPEHIKVRSPLAFTTPNDKDKDIMNLFLSWEISGSS